MGLELICVGISMVVGIFVGVRLGSWVGVFGGVGSGSKGWDCGVLGGRAWVISLPKFFLGKYFHFWKLPPLFCINNRDNVYYPIFFMKNSFHFFI